LHAGRVYPRWADKAAVGLLAEGAGVLTLPAPAKINATLEILARRSDGYHTLRSLMLPIGLYDRIEVAPGDAPSFAVEGALGDEAAVDNLVLRALAAANVRTPLRVHLTKVIPVGGGLGGGSSDAAAVLLAAMRGDLPGDARATDWNASARTLGSDVPFFLCGTGALVEGTGERVTPIGRMPPWWVVVVRPRESVSTADAYRFLAEQRVREPAPTRPRDTSASLAAIDALQRADFDAFEAALVNDFHDLVLSRYPVVAAAHAAFTATGAPRVLLSGSGSCLFAMFEDEVRARAVHATLAPAASADGGAIDASFVVPLHHDPAWR
jgi:4-diphosphocytidyl-2-C-methyl-D-erythritol kinase